MRRLTYIYTIMMLICLVSVSSCQIDNSKIHTTIPTKDLPIVWNTNIEAPDDIVPTPGGGTYRANVHQEGIENPWPSIESASLVIGTGTDVMNVSYRNYIQTSAGSTRNNIILITREGGFFNSQLALYYTNIPAGLALADGGRGVGLPGTLGAILVIETATDAFPGEYPLEIGLIINGKDYGIIKCTINVIPQEAVPVTSQCQAVNIAKENIPSSIIPKITAIGAATNPENQWFVDFVFLNKNNLVTKEELKGQHFQMDEGSTYNLIIVYINRQTGAIVKKMAKNGLVPGYPSFWVNCDSTIQNPQPIEVVSVLNTYQPGQPVNPAGPTVEITLKNVSYWPVVSLNVILKEEGARSFIFDFNVTPSNPLLLGESISAKQTLIGGGFGDGIPYSVEISGTLESGATFSYTYDNPEIKELLK